MDSRNNLLVTRAYTWLEGGAWDPVSPRTGCKYATIPFSVQHIFSTLPQVLVVVTSELQLKLTVPSPVSEA